MAVFGAWWPVHLLNLVVIILGLLLMLIVLIQRGKGGGLAGAFGGAGGSSPFGSRAADQFVKITLWLAGVWVLVIMIQVKVVKVDSMDEANVVLAREGEDLRRLFTSLRRFGTVSARFLGRHEDAIGRQFKALRPLLEGLAGAQGELRTDISQLRTFFELFPKSMGGGPGDRGRGDYIQAEAVICELFESCQTKGEKGDVPGEGS